MKRKELVITRLHHISHHSTDVLWQYKKEYFKLLANWSGASKVVSQMFEFDNSIYKRTD